MSRRVLIVAPHFAPISAPDGQRARTLAPHLREFGWEPHILTVDPAPAETPIEPDLSRTLPNDLPVTRVSAISARLARHVGLGNIAWRAWPALHAAGHRLLREQRFDLVYFSTTQFACLPLGRLWHRQHGVPFVIDLQDPWRSDFRLEASVRPPGGWKYRFAAAQARWLEPWTLRRGAGVISVSPAYLETLARRYPWWNSARGITLPMGWSERDFVAASTGAGAKTIDHNVIRYIGRLGPDMLSALDVLLNGFSRVHRRAPDCQFRCEFRGGSYDPRAIAGPAKIVAARYGVAPFVAEDPTRIPYLPALAALRSAGANIILGSDDSGYAPSKIWLTLAARRPWIALASVGTVLHALLSPHVGDWGRIVDPASDAAPDVIAQFFRSLDPSHHGPANESQLAAMEASELARRPAQFFENALSTR